MNGVQTCSKESGRLIEKVCLFDRLGLPKSKKKKTRVKKWENSAPKFCCTKLLKLCTKSIQKTTTLMH